MAMLRIAVPNKGQLAEPARAMLGEAGYLRTGGLRDLYISDLENDVEFYFLRPKDIAIYVGEGTLDLGISGRDMLLDSGSDAKEVLALGFAPSSFRFAAPIGSAKLLHLGLRYTAKVPVAGKKLLSGFSAQIRASMA